MAFLKQDDYKTQIREQAIFQVIENDNLVLQEAEIMAQKEMESYINQRFDVDEIFSQEEGDRDPLIKMYLIDMVVYHVFSRATPRNIPQIRIDRYDKAIAWLRDVATGKLTPALPALIDPDTEESASNSRFGSNEKFNSEY